MSLAYTSRSSPLVAPLASPAREHAFTPLRIEGRLPAGLRGTLYRNGPGLFDDVAVDHWFDGAGVLTAVRVDGGRAEGAVASLRPPGIGDAAQGRYRHRASWLNRARMLAGLGGGPNLANINVFAWRRRLFALYEAAPATEIDPDTLARRGEETFGGAVPALQAHPHRVASLRTTFHVGLRAGRRCFLDVFAFPDDGEPRRVAAVPIDGLNEVHDFFVTERAVVLVLAPLWANPLSLLTAGSFEATLRWQPERGNEVVVLPLDDPQRITRFTTGAFFWWHAANAWDDGDRVEVEWVSYPDFSNSEAVDRLRRGEAASADGRLWRGVIDPAAGTFDRAPVLDAPVEFPWVHDAVVGRRHRYTWAGAMTPPRGGVGWWDAWARRDAVTGDVAWVDPGPDRAVGEPILVPRSEREDDAWAVALVRDLRVGATHLAVWDAERPEAGVIARAWFDQLLPHALHGAWVPGA